VRYFRRYIRTSASPDETSRQKQTFLAARQQNNSAGTCSEKKRVASSQQQQQQQNERLHPLPNFHTNLKQAAGVQFRTLNFQQSTKISFQNESQL